MTNEAIASLDDWVRQHLASYKIPKTYAFVAELPRDGAGKIRRTALVAERSVGT